MTTDPEEGRRQIEAMKPPKLKVGDKVRLSAGGERVMIVVRLEDYGNMAVCDWEEPMDTPHTPTGAAMLQGRDTLPARSLVLVDEPKVG